MKRLNKYTQSLNKYLKPFIKSVWFFPIILTLLLIVGTGLKLSGTSMGVYYEYFTGTSAQNDPSLIAGQPRQIRSDEWIVSTQLSLAQASSDIPAVNQNLGTGLDMSVVVDVPFSQWTQLFKPHNWAFFVMDEEYAFAFKWWFLGYALMLAVYFFSLLILPGRKKIAVALSIAVVASPMIQWWYQYITLAPIYTALFATSVYILLLRTKDTWKRIGLGLAFAYFLASFAFVQYPAFQIPILIVIVSFAVGHLIRHIKNTPKREMSDVIKSITILGIAGVIALSLVGLFLYQKNEVVSSIQNTVYPGTRHIESGGYSIPHFFSGNLSLQMQRDSRAENYNISSIKAINQSESSNFIFLFPFLLIPLALLYFRDRKTRERDLKRIDIRIISVLVGSGVLLAWMYIPHLDFLGQITFLEIVPARRVLLGLGVANLLLVLLFISEYTNRVTLSKRMSLIYTGLVLAFFVALAVYWHINYPLFIGIGLALILALPVPLIVLLLLRKKYFIALGLYALFSTISVIAIHPLYHGLSVIDQTPLLETIKDTDNITGKRWLIEGTMIENFALMANQPSVSGVFFYPDPELWKNFGQDDIEDIYNRYAHVNYTLNRDGPNIKQAVLSNPGSDQMNIRMDPCDSFLEKTNVGYIITTLPFDQADASCLTPTNTVSYPAISFYIYRYE